MIEVQITVKPHEHYYESFRVEVEYQDGRARTRIYDETCADSVNNMKMDVLGLMIYQASPEARAPMEVPVMDAFIEHYYESTDADARVERFFAEFGRLDFTDTDLVPVKNIAVFHHDAEGRISECSVSLNIVGEYD